MGTITFNLSPWSTTVNIGAAGGCLCGGCDLTADADGHLYVSSVVEGGAIHIAHSADKGKTWNSVKVVTNGVEHYPHASTLLADAAGTVHLFYVDATLVPQHARSFDDGATWSTQAISGTLGNCSRTLDAITNSAKTGIYLILRDDDSGVISLLRSDDAGANWNPPVVISTPLPHLGWAVHMQLAMAGNEDLHIIAEAIINDQRDTFRSRSSDNGATWIPWDNSWHDGYSVAASLLASGKGQVFIVHTVGTTLTASISMNNGASWISRPILTTPYVFDLWSPPGLLKDPNGVINVFVYLGGGTHAIRHLHSDDHGITWSQGFDILSATPWKTPADIQAIWANGALTVAASLGTTETNGQVRLTTGDTLVIHRSQRLSRVEPDHIAAAVGNHLYLLDAGLTGNGSSIPSVLERVGLNPAGDDTVITVLEVWPDCSMDTDVIIQMGYQMAPDAAVTWHPPVTINPFTSDHAQVRITGRYIAIRFIIDQDCDWAMHGYSLVYEISGRC
ncbi:MAG: exo-alpha-sialidase [Magnetococcales bacterium]|nr:exo-alpha-sialidase [Magnetococcales bacterium]